MIEEQESITAKLCSFARAWHSKNAQDHVFDDYRAYDMMGKKEYDSICQMLKSGCPAFCHCRSHRDVPDFVCRYFAPIVLPREAFAQERFRGFHERHPDAQYVICGAGMDTFSFRNGNAGIDIFEIDHPDTQRYKKNRIKELGWEIRDNLHFVPVDFSKDNMTQKMIESGFDPERPAFFVILGVSYYLKYAHLDALIYHIRNVSRNAAGIVMDFPDRMTFSCHCPKRVRQLTAMTEKLGEKMTHGFAVEEIRRIMLSHDFSDLSHLPPRSIDERYIRGRGNLSAFETVHFMYAEKNSVDGEESASISYNI